MIAKDLFLFSWKKLLVLIVVWVLAVVLHNLVSALMGSEEAFLFILAVLIIPLYVLAAIVYNIGYFIKKKKKRKN